MLSISILAFDYGTKQIGVATGQTLTGNTQPIAVLKARDGQPDWPQLTALVATWQPTLLLVGLPLNMDASESELCARARKFARRLQGRLGLPVKMVDERLSTIEAKEVAGIGSTYNRKKPVDGIAAALILQTWLADPSCERTP